MTITHCIPQLLTIPICPATPIIYTAGRPKADINYQCEVWKLAYKYSGIIINDDERPDAGDRMESYSDLTGRFPYAKVYEYGVQRIADIKNYCIATNADEPVSPPGTGSNCLRSFVMGFPKSFKKQILLQDRTKKEQGYKLATENYLIELGKFCKTHKLPITVWTESFTGGRSEYRLVRDAKEAGMDTDSYTLDRLKWIIELLQKVTA